MAANDNTLAEITIVGPDQKGVVAAITNFIFESRGNIEKINQNVIKGLFGMQLEASFLRKTLNETQFSRGVSALERRLGMEIKVHFDEPNRLKNMAILVSKEAHCLESILSAKKSGRLKVNVPVIASSENTLAPLAKKHRIPFIPIDHKDFDKAEGQLLQLMERFDVDFIVLARYMRILSPNFVWRYPNRIINIHPSLLPAFTGAYAYMQAYERGAQIIGCTAHFVTEELDQGPIIWQDSFRVGLQESLPAIKQKGQQLEARTLLNSIQLYLKNRLEVYWGKVHIKNA